MKNVVPPPNFLRMKQSYGAAAKGYKWFTFFVAKNYGISYFPSTWSDSAAMNNCVLCSLRPWADSITLVLFLQPGSNLRFLEHVDLSWLQSNPGDHLKFESLMQFHGH